METASPFAALAISLGLGLLVGLQRERAGSRLAGVRTFPLIALLGTLAALAGERAGAQALVIAAGFVAVAAAMVTGNYLLARQEGSRDPGITTEIAILVVYVIGAYAAVGEAAVAMAVGVAVAVLLQAKGRLHGWARTIGDKDMRAIMLFAAITFIVLPVVPDQSFGPLGVWNPRNIWLMVVLVVGISLGAYVVYKLVGARAGAVLTGLLGGMVSSTATAVTLSRRARESEAYAGPALLAIALASAVVYVRLMVEIGVVAPEFFGSAVGPLSAMLGLSVVLAGAVWLVKGRDGDSLPEPENPTELKPALMFAALYAVVLLAAAWARIHLGDRGVYAVAAVSGLTDMDAITLSTSRMVESGGMSAGAAWRAIVLAAVSNMAFKTGIVAVIGGRRLGTMAAGLFGLKIAAALLLVLFWP